MKGLSVLNVTLYLYDGEGFSDRNHAILEMLYNIIRIIRIQTHSNEFFRLLQRFNVVSLLNSMTVQNVVVKNYLMAINDAIGMMLMNFGEIYLYTTPTLLMNALKGM